MKKEPPLWLGRLSDLLVLREEVCVYLVFTAAIPTTKRSLIIRTEIRTTIRERLKIDAFISIQIVRPIIGLIEISSRAEDYKSVGGIRLLTDSA
jgi:hypothetical protein